MVDGIEHRGPDGRGFYHDAEISLGHARLSIIDIENGHQPVYNADQSVVVIFNGEIFNYKELAKDLRSQGRVLASNSDSAIIPHLYEEFGLEFFAKLNGQFAIAIWDKNKSSLILGRDRFGEKPLYYSRTPRGFVFASEAKAIIKSNLVEAVISANSIGRILSCWSSVGHDSVFKNISIVPEGSYVVLSNGDLRTTPYWSSFACYGRELKFKDESEAAEELEAILRRAVSRRLVSDVPMGFLLSGGIDSSLISAIGSRALEQPAATFSITFRGNPHLDEERYQRTMADFIAARHRSIDFSSHDITRVIKEAVWHTEEPFVRPAVFPMFMLTRYMKSKGVTVALTGEGADELFAGYDIYRDVKLSNLMDSRPGEKRYAWAYDKLHRKAAAVNGSFFDASLGFMAQEPYARAYRSHIEKWRGGSQLLFLLSAESKARIQADAERSLWNSIMPPDRLASLSPLKRAQHLDKMLLLTNYHLSVQGDKISMANAVECRYPFLDPEVVNFAGALPENLLLRGLSGKHLLKQVARKYVPDDILRRKKFVYKSPINIGELLRNEEVAWLLSPERLRAAGIFDPSIASRYVAMRKNTADGAESDVSAVLAVLTTQYLHHLFVDGIRS